MARARVYVLAASEVVDKLEDRLMLSVTDATADLVVPVSADSQGDVAQQTGADTMPLQPLAPLTEKFASPANGTIQADGSATSGPLIATAPGALAASAQDANSPIGVAQGIYPGRVAWVRDTNATSGTYNTTPGAAYGRFNDTGYFWDDTHTNQAVVSAMMGKALRYLTKQTTDSGAWDALFRYFNVNHGYGNIGYTVGEKIVIKVNLNSSDDVNNTSAWNYADPTPASIYALLDQLVNVAGANQQDITIYDSLKCWSNKYWDKLHGAFPNVHYVDRYGTDTIGPDGRAVGPAPGREKAQPSANGQIVWTDGQRPDSVPSVVAQAKYMINMAVAKKHDGAGVTLGGKNNYGSMCRRPDTALSNDGTTAWPQANVHATRASDKPGMGNYRQMVDLMGSDELGGKTFLYLNDAIWGGWNWGGANSTPTVWETLGNDYFSSLFASQDPVAIDSVVGDFLVNEDIAFHNNSAHSGGNYRGNLGQIFTNWDDYLHEAALAGSPGARLYDPNGNGTFLQSLGTHEHWNGINGFNGFNNATDRQYSRNLHTGLGIELVRNDAEAYNPNVTVTVPAANANITANSSLTLTATASDLNTGGSVTHVDFYVNGSFVYSDTSSAGGWTYNWSSVPAGQYSVTAWAYDNDTQIGVSPAVTFTSGQVVWVEASTARAAEYRPSGVKTGEYIIHRIGSTSSPLTVNLATMAGTATSGSDYTALPTSATILAGQENVHVLLTPIDDALSDADETAVLTLATGSGYAVGLTSSATVTIEDNETAGTPAAPQFEVSSGTPTSATLTWAPIGIYSSTTGQWSAPGQYVAGYTIERSTDGTNFTQVSGGDVSETTTSFTDTGLTAGTQYYYRMRAYNYSGTTKTYGSYSSSGSWNGNMNGGIVGQPGVKWSMLGQIRGTVWNDLNGDGTRQAGDPGLRGATVYIDANSDGTFTSATDPSTTVSADGSYVFRGLAAGTYTVRMALPASVIQTGGASSYSVALSAAQSATGSNFVVRNVNLIDPSTPTITWLNPADITYGTPLSSTQLNATASVPGTFSYSQPVGTVLGAGAGQTLSVLFTPTDTIQYKTATASTLINVNKAHLTVTADDKRKTYNSYGFSGFTASCSGFVNGDTAGVVSGSPSFSGPALSGVNAGSYTVTPAAGTLTASNYDFTTFASGTLTIDKVHLTLTADSKTKTYDGSVYSAFTATLSGFVYGENSSLVSGSPAFTGSAVSAVDAGSYTVTPAAGTLAATNYDVAVFNGATLTISKVHLTVTADARTKTYDGSAVSGFTTSYSGFANGETASVVSGNAAFSGSAVGAVNAGSYTLTPSAGTLAAANYDFTAFNSATVTINKAHLTVTADPKTKTYDRRTYSGFTATLGGFVNGETSSVVSGSPAFSGTALTAVDAGTYTVTPALGTLAAGNYDFTTFSSGSLVISPAETSTALSVPPADSAYGQPVTLTANVNSTSNYVPQAGTVTVNLKFSDGSTSKTAAVGTYTINVYADVVGNVESVEDSLYTLYGSMKSIKVAGGSLLGGIGEGITAFSLDPAFSSASSQTGAPSSTLSIDSIQDWGSSSGVLFTSYVKPNGRDGASAPISFNTPGVTATRIMDGSNIVGTEFLLGQATFTITSGTVTGAGSTQVQWVKPAWASTSVMYGKCGIDSTTTLTNFGASTNTGIYQTNGTFVTFTAPGTSGGTVTFKDGATILGTGTLDGSGQATFTTSSLPAGTHSITAVYAGDGNSNGSTSSVVTHVVTQATPTITWGNPADITYGTALSSTQLSATASVPGTFAYSQPAGTVLDAGNSQTLNVTFTPTDTVNYTTATASVPITVSKADLYVTASANSKTYGQTASDSGTIIGIQNGDSITAAFASSGDAANAGAGSYTITADLSDPGNRLSNYTLHETDAALTVNKAHLTVTADAQSKTYDGAAFSGFTAGLSGFVNGESSSVVSGSAEFTGDAIGAFHAGDYTITPTAGSLAATNYDFPAGSFASGALTIGKADADIVVTPYNLTYDGHAHTATATATGVEASPDDLSSLLTLTNSTHTTAGDYALDSWTFAGNGDYNPASGTVHSHINKAHLTVTADAQSKTYDGSVFSSFTAGLSGFVNGEASSVLSGSAEFTGDAIGAFHAGDYTITPTLGSLAATNYDFPAGNFASGALTIGKADADIVVTPYNLTYDGHAHTATATATGVEASPDDLSSLLTLTGSTHTNAGDYAADAWTFAGNGDYNPASGSVHNHISKAHLTVTADAQNKTYDGSAFSGFTAGLSGFVNGESSSVVSGSAGFAGDAIGAFHAGEYIVTPTAGSLAATNYDFPAGSFASGALTIGKADADIVVTPYNLTYDGHAHTTTATATGVEASPDDLSSLLTLTSSTHTDAGDYAADEWTFAGNGDYNSASGTVHNHINKAHLTVTADAQSKTYDGSAFSGFTAGLSGFVNGETSSVVGGSAGFTGDAVGAIDAGTYSVTPAAGTLAATNYDFATFNAASIVINQAGTAASVSASPSPGVAGQPLTLTATITLTSGAGTPTGSVTFKDGTTILGTADLDGSGHAALTTSALSVGSHSITAVYAGDTNFTGATSDPAALVVNQPVTITQQPANQTVNQNGPATFSVAASGTLPLTYQWLRNGDELTDGGNISGATTDTLTIGAAGASDGGTYTCIVSNVAGSVPTDPATLTVNVASVASNVLWFHGTGGADTMSLDAAGGILTATVNGTTMTFPAAGIDSIRVAGVSGADTLTLTGGTFTFGTNVVADAPNLTIVVGAGATASFAADQTLAGLTLGAGGSATLAAGTNALLVTGGLNIDPAASLDINDGAVIVKGAAPGAWDAGPSAYTDLTGLLAAGRIRSTAAALDAAMNHGLSIMTAEQAQANGNPLTGGFHGQTVSGGDVLLQCGWNGDVNLDGVVNYLDYGTIDNAYLYNIAHGGSAQLGYGNGDLTLDGVINYLDYGMIDNAFLASTGPHAMAAAAASAPALATTGVAFSPALGADSSLEWLGTPQSADANAPVWGS